jgi:hypothetical protein
MDGNDCSASTSAYQTGPRNRGETFPKAVGSSQVRYVFAYFRLPIITGTRTPKVPKKRQKQQIHTKKKKY